jgi:predicted metal-binding protein
MEERSIMKKERSAGGAKAGKGSRKGNVQMEKIKTYAAAVLERGVDHALIIDPATVVTAPWVRFKCRYGCLGYGLRLCCPPNTPTWDETRVVLDSYAVAILMHRHWKKNYVMVDEFNTVATDLERTIFLDGFYKAFAMGSGPCRGCEECNLSGTCRHPDKGRPSMESCGIDVYATAHAHGLPIDVVRTHEDERDLYALVLIE